MPDGAERAALGDPLEREGLRVDAVTSCEELWSLTESPDFVIARRSFAAGLGSVAVCLARPPGPADADRTLAELAHALEALLVERLRVDRAEIARRLPDLVPAIATAAALEYRRASERTSGAGRLAMKDFVQELEDCLIVLMLSVSRSDREAGLWLGLNEATLRSKMRKRCIRSPRARVRSHA